jgi:hypothetical protein
MIAPPSTSTPANSRNARRSCLVSGPVVAWWGSALGVPGRAGRLAGGVPGLCRPAPAGHAAAGAAADGAGEPTPQGQGRDRRSRLGAVEPAKGCKGRVVQLAYAGLHLLVTLPLVLLLIPKAPALPVTAEPHQATTESGQHTVLANPPHRVRVVIAGRASAP